MTPPPHVTVVLAAYNAEHVVGRAVASIVAQTHPSWDLLAIDDGSTDGTIGVLERAAAADSRIEVVRNDRNRGLAASLNDGWRRARGELVARMDADDVSLPDRLQRQASFLARHPEVDVLGTGARLVDADGRVLRDARRPERHEELVARMYKETPFFHPSVMARRSFLDRAGGYDERLRRSQDIDLWLRTYRRFRFHNLPEPLIEYRVPGRPPLAAIAWGTYVLARAAYREGLLPSRGWYSLRFLAATSLSWLGLRRLRFG